MAANQPPEAPEQRQAAEDALLEQHMRSLSQVRDPTLRFLAEELLAQLRAIRHADATVAGRSSGHPGNRCTAMPARPQAGEHCTPPE